MREIKDKMLIPILAIDQTTVQYVIYAPFFWLSMGMTAGIAVFVGAIIYDGNLSAATKGLISVILYSFLIFHTSWVRITDLIAKYPEKADPTRYGGLLTIIILTVFWIIGIFLGVGASHLVRKKGWRW